MRKIRTFIDDDEVVSFLSLTTVVVSSVVSGFVVIGVTSWTVFTVEDSCWAVVGESSVVLIGGARVKVMIVIVDWLSRVEK